MEMHRLETLVGRQPRRLGHQNLGRHSTGIQHNQVLVGENNRCREKNRGNDIFLRSGRDDKSQINSFSKILAGIWVRISSSLSRGIRSIISSKNGRGEAPAMTLGR